MQHVLPDKLGAPEENLLRGTKPNNVWWLVAFLQNPVKKVQRALHDDVGKYVTLQKVNNWPFFFCQGLDILVHSQ